MKFENKDGTFSAKTTKYYENVLAYAEKYNLRNTLISLSLALELHNQQFRDGGAPYIKSGCFCEGTMCERSSPHTYVPHGRVPVWQQPDHGDR